MSHAKRLSFASPHNFIVLTESTSGLYIGAGPLPVFALVSVPLEHAQQIHAMLGRYIEAERSRREVNVDVTCYYDGHHSDGSPAIKHSCDPGGACPLDGVPR